MFEAFFLLRRSDEVYLTSVCNLNEDLRPIVRRVAGGLSPSQKKVATQAGNHYVFAVLDDDAEGGGLVYVIVGSEMGDKSEALRLLAELRTIFMRMYPPTAEPIATLSSDRLADFRSIVVDRAVQWISSSPNGIKAPLAGDLRLHTLTKDVDSLKDVVADAVTSIVERGDRFANIVSATDEVDRSASMFYDRSNALARAARWRNIRTTVILCAIVVAMLLVIYVAYR